MAKKKFKDNDLVVCIMSASPGYKKGNNYTVVTNDKGQLGIKADDGFFDLLSMMVSEFRHQEETAQERALRVWNKNGLREKGTARQPTTTQD